MEETAYCFRCEESFEITPKHQQDYMSSGLCPACFGESLAEMYKEIGSAEVSIEKHCANMVRSLDQIIADIKGINDCIREILKEYKK